MDFPPFEHAAWLARAWRRGAPRHDLGASGFRSPVVMDILGGPIESQDVEGLDLHAETELRDALAARDGVAPDQVRVTAGTSSANAAVIASLVESGTTVVCERPTYLPLPALAEGFGARIRWVDGPDGLADAVSDDTSLVLLTSPNNPTGRPVPEAALRRIGDAAAAVGAHVVVDQVYRELTDRPVAASLHDAIVSTAGFNKCWGAPGLRVGWATGHPDVMARVEDTHRLMPLAPPTFGTRMARRLLDHEALCRAALDDHLEAAHELYRAWAKERGIDADVHGLVAFPAVPDSQATAERLVADGILTVPGECFGTPGHLRVGFGAGLAQLEAALAALAAGLDTQTF